MTLHITESIWLNATDTCSFEHIVEVSGLKKNDLLSLVEAEVISPTRLAQGHYEFQSDCIVLARTAKRLQEDFELNIDGLILALSLVQRINQLETRLAAPDVKKSRRTPSAR